MDYMQLHRLIYCSVCSHTLSSRYHGVCPSCQPIARSRRALPVDDLAAPASGIRPRDQPAMPSLEEVHTRSVPVLKFIPGAPA
jgi:hypothetical protein